MPTKSLLVTAVLVLGPAACSSEKPSTERVAPVASAAGAFEPYLEFEGTKQGKNKGTSPKKPPANPTPTVPK